MGTRNLDGTYTVTREEIEEFQRDGFVHLVGVLTEDEVAELEVVYDRFLRREIEVPGKDYCDMAGDYGRDPGDYSIVNVMLPRRTTRRGRATSTNGARRQVASTALRRWHGHRLRPAPRQAALQGRRRVRLAPGHGVLAATPTTGGPPRSGCAVDDSTVENGCMRFVPATNHEEHAPASCARLRRPW